MKVETVKFDFGSPYSTPSNMIATLAEHQDKANALVEKVSERMNQELVALREKLLGEIPKPNIAAYRAELEKARKAAQKRLEDGIAAARGSISEVDHLTCVVLLQSRVIGGVNLEQLFAELGDYKALSSLATLAEQLERADIAGEARAKAIDIATNGAQREIDLLSGCLLDLVNAEANYYARWRLMLEQIGGDGDE